MVIWTVGHSTRDATAFVALLRRSGVGTLADVRAVPRSRRVPWANVDVMPDVVAPIPYVHIPQLGGMRTPRLGSPNDAWREEAFRGYADHMVTAEFERGVARLLALERPCVMCAEALPSRCHRSLLADALVARGHEVVHILDEGEQPHEMTLSARVRDGRVTYPAGAGRQTTLGS